MVWLGTGSFRVTQKGGGFAEELGAWCQGLWHGFGDVFDLGAERVEGKLMMNRAALGVVVRSASFIQRPYFLHDSCSVALYFCGGFCMGSIVLGSEERAWQSR